MATPIPAIPVVIEDEPNMGEEVQKELQLIRDRILHALDVLPFLTSSGIHQLIGTSTSTGLWRPILMQLVAEGVVCKTEVFAQTPLNRTQSYIIYHHSRNTYTPSNPNITAKPVQ